MPETIIHPANRPIHLHNLNCAYCGREFSPELSSTKEHVIGRRFVPKGTLAGQWNLILRACRDCNHEKSQLEDDISVITMLPDAVGRYPIEDERVRAEVLRRAEKSGSRRTGRSVAQSHECATLSGSPVAGMRITLGFVAPPQADHERLHRLAELHFTAFFFLSTYSQELRRGGFSIGPFFRIAAIARSNWGTARAQWFMDLTRDWVLRSHGIAADGFFKIVIRKCPTAQLWSYAVEWNHTMRVLEFSGEQAAMNELLRQSPCFEQPPERSWTDGANNTIGIALETPIDPEHDFLFTRVDD